jgi:uncharacterized protein (TIGR02611 family)
MRTGKAVRIVTGFAVLAAGLIMAVPFVPGPGIAVIIAGLIILSPHFDWARRLLDWAKRKTDPIRKRILKKVPRHHDTDDPVR